MEALQREAYYHFFLGDYLTAATRLKIAEETPGNSERALNDTRLLLGGLYISWGMYRPATELFDRWVTRFPPGGKRNELLLLIERLQYRRSLYRGAIDTYAKLLPDEDFPSWDYARYLAGMSHYMSGSFRQGIGLLDEIPGTSGDFPYARMAMAQSYVQLNDDKMALMLWKELAELNARGDPALKALAEKSRLNMGLLLIEMGRYTEADAVLSSIPDASPFIPDALFGQGWAEFDAGRYPQALPYFQKLVRSFPEHPYALEGLLSIGGTYQRIGASAKSLESYGEALRIYDQKEKDFRRVRALIQDRSQLVGWLQGGEVVPESSIEDLLDDEVIRYRISQYREVSSLADFLDRKLAEMGVFKIMLDHRQEVYRGHLPTLRGFLAEDPVQPLRNRAALLQARIKKAVREEDLNTLATDQEREILNQLDRATAEGKRLERTAGHNSLRTGGNAALMEELKDANRKLALLRGEVVWKIITEAPGRIDDLRREAKKLDEQLTALDAREKRLTASIPTLEGRLSELGRRIDKAGQSLVRQKEAAAGLQARLLPPLQALLLEAVNNKQDRMERLAAAARLSQIQILDAKSRP